MERVRRLRCRGAGDAAASRRATGFRLRRLPHRLGWLATRCQKQCPTAGGNLPRELRYALSDSSMEQIPTTSSQRPEFVPELSASHA